MSESNKPIKKTRYINPYLGGVLLGLVLIAANFISGRGLGASGAAKSAVVATVNTVAPNHAENAQFFNEYNASHPDGPMKAWLVFQTPDHFRPYGWNPVWIWITTGPWMHQWLGTQWHGSALPGGVYLHGIYFRNRICTGLVLQKELDLTFYISRSWDL